VPNLKITCNFCVKTVKIQYKTSKKEETKVRISSDTVDRDGINQRLSGLIDSLDLRTDPENIVNIATWVIMASTVNCHYALTIGRKQTQTFEHQAFSCQ